jgi:hypothetical protein
MRRVLPMQKQTAMKNKRSLQRKVMVTAMRTEKAIFPTVTKQRKFCSLHQSAMKSAGFTEATRGINVKIIPVAPASEVAGKAAKLEEEEAKVDMQDADTEEDEETETEMVAAMVNTILTTRHQPRQSRDSQLKTPTRERRGTPQSIIILTS